MADEPIERELETIFEAKEESEAWAVQGLLQSSGIEAEVISVEFPQDIMPGIGGTAVRVPAGQAAEARQIVSAYQNQPPTAAEMSGTDAAPLSGAPLNDPPLSDPKIPSPS